MQKKKLFAWIILAILGTALIVSGILYGNSYQIALRNAGISGNNAVIIDAGIDANGNDYRAVIQMDSDTDPRFAYLTKTNGFWKAEFVEDRLLQKTGWLNAGWLRLSGNSAVAEYAESEVHMVFVGKHAFRAISIPDEMLPPNVAVNIHQVGDCFVLHFVGFGESTILNAIKAEDLQDYLLSNGYIYSGK